MNPDSTYVHIYLWACWFFGLAGTVDVLLQPRSAFQATGRSKLAWFLIQLIGTVLVGIFTWAYYAIRIRPGLVRAGGRPPRQVLRAMFASSADPGSRSKERQTTDGTRPPNSRQRQTCSACGGRGRTSCAACGGKGQLYQHNPTAGQELSRVACQACGGQGGHPCSSCQGKGRVD